EPARIEKGYHHADFVERRGEHDFFASVAAAFADGNQIAERVHAHLVGEPFDFRAHYFTHILFTARRTERVRQAFDQCRERRERSPVRRRKGGGSRAQVERGKVRAFTHASCFFASHRQSGLPDAAAPRARVSTHCRNRRAKSLPRANECNARESKSPRWEC